MMTTERYTRTGRDGDFIDGSTGRRLRLTLLERGMEDTLKLGKIRVVEMKIARRPEEISEVILDAEFECNT